MAVVKFSGLITSMVGKINGSVLQGGSYGTIIRSNRYGRKYASLSAFKSRSAFNSVQSFNKTFDGSEKDAFQSFASTLFRPTKAGAETPYNWWTLAQHINSNIFKIGGTMRKSPFLVPTAPLFASVDVKFTEGDEFFEATWDGTLGEDWVLVCFVSPPSRERTPFKKSRSRQVAIFPCADGIGDILFEDITTIFGGSGTANPRWFAFEKVHTATGWSVPILTSLYIPA